MYKIVTQPGTNNASAIITVFQKKDFFYLGYWNSVERVLCDNRYMQYHLDHFTAKYNVSAESCSPTIQEIQAFS